MIADFLNTFRPGGPWLLVAIHPDKKGSPLAVSFQDAAQAETWATKRNKTHNIYFSINPAAKALNKKPTKADIARLEWLHVDLDPRAGEDFEQERQRIKSLLNGGMPKDIPAPSLVIDSGGGYWGLWRLAEPLDLNGDPDKIVQAEAFNVELANRLGGDHCFNIDRIARLPGLTNWPDAKKRAKGREPREAEVYSRTDAAYPLTAFKAAPPKAEAINGGTPPASRTAPKATGTGIPTAVGTEELRAWADANEKRLDDYPLALIATGDASDFGNDRSAMVFKVCCDLVRAGVPDEMIVGVLLDRNNPVSAHVLEQKGDTRKYAWRQVLRARESVDAQHTAGSVSGYAPRWEGVSEKTGTPAPTFHNTIEALLALGVEFRFDEFKGQKVIGGHYLQEYAGPLTDRAEVFLRRAIRLRWGFDVKKEPLHEAITELCEVNRFDSLRDHLESLPPWDGTPRLDTWLIDFCGAQDTPMVRQAGAAFLTAAVVRAFEPGAKFDYMLILVGQQGIRKSAALRVLASGVLDSTCTDRFSDAPLLGAKDGREVLELTGGGVWIQECAELDGITKKDVSALKAMIVRTHDKGRLVWSRTPVEIPRRFVLAGTTNERRFLQDPTGNRRFWPVDVDRIDLEALAAARDQLLAEVLARYRSGNYRLWLEGEAEAEAAAAQADRVVIDEGFREMLELIKAEGEHEGRRYVTNERVYRVLGLDRRNRAGAITHRVRSVMERLGWQPSGGPVRIEGSRQRVYFWNGDGEPPEIVKDPF
ncbi:MAG: hypothetical protein DWB43_10720 [Lautropia sp.]|nr:MAG: hypothetical protein EDM78_09010 [Pseudomonadota bacterium]MBC6959989.1 hypothetical protein [Lautropia sp.]MCL4701897.1 hypothetical protein [Burkholderiaceae bacterium]MDL1907507.1 hypothetical protein [Betaproteobacteria bacterium PRO1]RIK87413.1 MAG: hypothetical protein DCC70_12540 [Burkholderiales bacterium]